MCMLSFLCQRERSRGIFYVFLVLVLVLVFEKQDPLCGRTNDVIFVTVITEMAHGKPGFVANHNRILFYFATHRSWDTQLSKRTREKRKVSYRAGSFAGVLEGEKGLYFFILFFIF